MCVYSVRALEIHRIIRLEVRCIPKGGGEQAAFKLLRLTQAHMSDYLKAHMCVCALFYNFPCMCVFVKYNIAV